MNARYCTAIESNDEPATMSVGPVSTQHKAEEVGPPPRGSEVLLDSHLGGADAEWFHSATSLIRSSIKL